MDKSSVKEAILEELFGEALSISKKIEEADKSIIISTDLVVSKTNEALGAFVVKIDTLKTILESPENRVIEQNKKGLYLFFLLGSSIGLAIGVLLAVSILK